MKVAVLSPEDEDPRERAVLEGLLDAGLRRYHVRKPMWTAGRLETWLRALPADWRPRLVLHAHPGLAESLGLGGSHGPGQASRSCHTHSELRDSLGQCDSVFFGPIYPSISKSGHGPSRLLSLPGLAAQLIRRTPAERRTAVFALGGITAGRVQSCRELGFDGVAVLGGVWQAPDPVRAFSEVDAAAREAGFDRIMCLTHDGLGISHAEQAARLCAAGARLIQLRMKDAAPDTWLATAREVASICRRRGARCIVNDSVSIALAVDADGVHLGASDFDWREARRLLGPRRLLGGTVNDAAGAGRALAAGCLDYVGVGPLRFTATKKAIAPVLGLEGVRALLARLGGLPAWVIGGVRPEDMPALRDAGAAGAAVSSALFRPGRPEDNLAAFAAGWISPRDAGRLSA
jgi:thiamine-phosphate pyrophosphorylase